MSVSGECWYRVQRTRPSFIPVAQLAEQRIPNPQVRSSTLLWDASFMKIVAQVGRAEVTALQVTGSNPVCLPSFKKFYPQSSSVGRVPKDEFGGQWFESTLRGQI